MGCAELTELEREERDWRRVIDKENWEMCELVYKQSGAPTWHIGHVHSRTGRPQSLQAEAHNNKSDLITNRCKSILGDYWIKY